VQKSNEPLITPGWSRATSTVDDCGDFAKNLREKYVAMLRSVGGAKMCVAGCDQVVQNDDLIAAVNQLPKYPFALTYWFDSDPNAFAGQNTPGLYLAISNAANVTEVRFYKDAVFNSNNMTEDAFAVRANSGSAVFTLFVGMGSLGAGPVRVELDTKNGNTYVVSLPHIQPL
jgi:hypothetical protein